MIQVSRPMPAPKTRRPRSLVAADTGSVAMKNAPSIVAPEARWNAAPAYAPGSRPCAIAAGTAMPASMATGICQRMTPRSSSQPPPASAARLTHSAPVAPTAPNAGPANISSIV
jgi:hypothetical protein